MNEKRTSLLQNTVKISGNLQTVEDAVLGPQSLAVLRGGGSEEMAISSLLTDKDRLHIYLGAVTDIDVARQQRGEFFSRIDGSYYGSTPRIDTGYVQGDYGSGLAKLIAVAFMPASMNARDEGDDKTADLLEVLAQGRTEKSMFFGYVNDTGIPCGMQILTFKVGNQLHYIISHTEHLDKPRSERQASVYMNREIYQLLKSVDMLHADSVVEKNPEQITQSYLSPQELPQDLFATVNHVQLNQELRVLFNGKKPTIRMSYGGYQGERDAHKVILDSKEITPIGSLPEKATRPEIAQPYELFRQAAEHQKRTAASEGNYLSDDQTKDLAKHQWINFIIRVLNNLPSLESGMLSQLRQSDDFKHKILVQKKCSELEKLRSDIADGREKNPGEAVGKILDAMVVSRDSSLSDFVAEQRHQFRMMRDYEHLHESNVRKENTTTAVDPAPANKLASSGSSIGSEKENITVEVDPAPANELANSGSSIGSESGDDPEEESDHTFSM